MALKKKKKTRLRIGDIPSSTVMRLSADSRYGYLSGLDLEGVGDGDEGGGDGVGQGLASFFG